MTIKYKIILAAALVITALTFIGISQFLISSANSKAVKAASAEEEQRLKQVFPDADTFSVKSGDLPHHKAYKTDPDSGETTLLGFVFMTHEVEPNEMAYSSRIRTLVGMTTEGIITKIMVVDHREPFGYFSIDPPEFVEQFEGKSILDPFEEGRDIDSVTRATITIKGIGRVIRKSARQIAQQHLREGQTN